MGLRKFGLFAAAAAVAMVFGFIQYRKPPQHRHVFINETPDHRFDESIKVSILAAFQRTGVQNAVVISDRDEENDLAKSAVEAFRDLKLGKSNNGRAILYYFNPRSRSLKIEVGYALEGVLPDATVKGLEMAAKSFIFVDKYQDFWAELINTLNIEIQKKEKKGRAEVIDYDFSKFQFLSGGGGVFSNSYSDSWQQLLKESRRALGTFDNIYRAQKEIHLLIELYLESLAKGFGDMDLDLLSQESQFFRKITPHSSYQMFRNARMFADAGVDQIIIEGKLAFVFFKPENPVLPLVFKKTDEVWRVQEPLSWSLFQRFEDSNKVFLKYPIQGLSKNLKTYLDTKIGGPVYDLSTALTLDFLAGPASNDWKSSLLHLYWLDKAENDFEKVGLPNLSNDELMMASDVLMNLGHVSKFLAAYEALAKRLPDNKGIQRNWAFYQDVLVFQEKDWILSRP